MPIANDEQSTNAMGGTELLKSELVKRIETRSPGLLDNFQIFVSRVDEEIDKEKIVIYWLHDLATDPAAANNLTNGKWEDFDFFVFVSNWQFQMYNLYHGIPYNRSIILENSIIPFKEEELEKTSNTIKLIYTPTPHRGLELLVPAFIEAHKRYPEITLDVFSSFNLYGWPQRDEPYEKLFQTCRDHEAITYHGTKSNDEVRKALAQSHIFAYPSIWQETSCLCQIEAMSAKLLCVHPNYGALPDTCGGMSIMYQWDEDVNAHINRFFIHMVHAIEMVKNDVSELKPTLTFQKIYADRRFGWDQREIMWNNLLTELVNHKDDLFKARKTKNSSQAFVINTEELFRNT